MRRPANILIVLCVGIGMSSGHSASAQTAAAAEEEALERVELLDGRSYRGYIESEDSVWVNVRQIIQPQGRPMFLVVRPIARESIKKVVRLDPPQRARLRERIDRLINRAAIEQGRMDAVRLDVVTRHGNHSFRYSGKWFTLDCRAEESIARRMVVRTEQVFTAYRQIVAPRVEPRRPLRIVVFDSMDAYRSYLARLEVKLDRPACYVPADNLLIAGSELARLAAELTKIRAEHDQIEAELDRLEEQLPIRLKELAERLEAEGVADIRNLLLAERRKFQTRIEEKRVELRRCNRRNAGAFDACTSGMFARLYHESFHAYLENYVYPRDGHSVPLWLNEGLAVTFERGVLETDTFRIDAPNRRALAALKADLATDDPLPLADVLAADQEAFLASEEAPRYYAHAWGLAYYLTFERQLLRGATLDRYVQPARGGESQVERFEKLVDMPLAEFEPLWRDYIAKLR